MVISVIHGVEAVDVHRIIELTLVLTIKAYYVPFIDRAV